jgi:class 3 adenylate cyclase
LATPVLLLSGSVFPKRIGANVGCGVLLSLRSKIILTLLPLGLGCLAIGGALGYREADRALRESVERALTAQREAKRHGIEAYIRDQLRFTDAVASAPVIAEASKAFIAALKEMRAALIDPAEQNADRSTLETWYRNIFVPTLDKVSAGHAEASNLLPSDPTSRRLQVDYVARNPDESGKTAQFDAAPRGDAYDRVHARFHPIIRHLAQAVGFHDINLVDPETGDVFYGVAKEADFLSNIRDNAFGGTGFAQIVERAIDPRNGGRAVVQDFTAYPPSGFAPQLFTAFPVMADGRPIAVLVAQIDVGALNRVLTDNGEWAKNGEGQTGEVILVGEDRLMRSQSRFLEQDSQEFIAELRSSGVPETTLRLIETLDSTILSLPVNTDAVERAFHNQSGVEEFTDGRGEKVLGAFGPLEVAGLRWAVVAKQDVSEAIGPVVNLRRDLLAAAGLSTVVLTLFALASASVFIRPIRRILGAMASATDNRGIEHIPVKGSDEFAELQKGYNAMADAIEERDRRIAALEQDKDRMLHSIYPAVLADRLQRGVETTAETVSNVTVAVCYVDGLEPPGAPLSASEAHGRLNTLFDALLATATEWGVEPVRSLGESYIVVCGLSSRRLDHADRTVAWSRAAAQAVSHIAADWAQSVTLRFGMASGDIEMLVFSAGHTPYDIWGRPLRIARLAALAATPGAVRIDESAYAILSDAAGFRACAPIGNPAWGHIATWEGMLSQPAAQAAQ